MSEDAVPYRPTPEAPAFTPRPVRFRVWEAGEMRPVDLYWFEENGVRECPGGPVSPGYGGPDAYVMQSTRLRDADGTEVFEGDVILAASRLTFRIEWDDEEARWVGTRDGMTTGLTAGWVAGTTVVGNVYEGVRGAS